MAQDKPAVIIAKDEDSVGMTLCAVLQAQAIQTCEEKGHFYFAISGGSMLNMLSNLAVNPAIDSMVPWDACTMGFVSHRAVPLDDDELLPLDDLEDGPARPSDRFRPDVCAHSHLGKDEGAWLSAETFL